MLKRMTFSKQFSNFQSKNVTQINLLLDYIQDTQNISTNQNIHQYQQVRFKYFIPRTKEIWEYWNKVKEREQKLKHLRKTWRQEFLELRAQRVAEKKQKILDEQQRKQDMAMRVQQLREKRASLLVVRGQFLSEIYQVKTTEDVRRAELKNELVSNQKRVKFITLMKESQYWIDKENLESRIQIALDNPQELYEGMNLVKLVKEGDLGPGPP
eukprot:TRINITY_DN17878_c0_g1_i5.p1 TRINITY_DN17878_c0_g1~~TRINITY_DN17878_c0_g1_i5.p1  ORF type:complete len:212 (+),score=34.97 TRINITY_DN17878_c0_g1_i5:254-889(+)